MKTLIITLLAALNIAALSDYATYDIVYFGSTRNHIVISYSPTTTTISDTNTWTHIVNNYTIDNQFITDLKIPKSTHCYNDTMLEAFNAQKFSIFNINATINKDGKVCDLSTGLPYSGHTPPITNVRDTIFISKYNVYCIVNISASSSIYFTGIYTFYKTNNFAPSLTNKIFTYTYKTRYLFIENTPTKTINKISQPITTIKHYNKFNLKGQLITNYSKHNTIHKLNNIYIKK